ncbi:hypothetical protein [Paenibacillus donghaensis]|uniref:Uncharacterized protein n=1 Tax=Paenibacillus donghaensis TaxID=414771 RepID=A0A2Z2K6X7_9BACL|nr:hypothetical protein [Paenibacillus donghaensis]ASA22046.1 hypothetical protein B9T62_15440 [Paenibacillus donghaensis]
MSKFNLNKDERLELIKRFMSGPFTLDEMVDFIKKLIELDIAKITEQAWKDKARQIIGSFRDGEGLRQIASYDASADNETRRMVYQVINSCMDPLILNKQMQGMVKRRDGSDKLIQKVQERLNQVADQADLFNFSDFDFDGSREEEAE